VSRAKLVSNFFNVRKVFGTLKNNYSKIIAIVIMIIALTRIIVVQGIGFGIKNDFYESSYIRG